MTTRAIELLDEVHKLLNFKVGDSKYDDDEDLLAERFTEAILERLKEDQAEIAALTKLIAYLDKWRTDKILSEANSRTNQK